VLRKKNAQTLESFWFWAGQSRRDEISIEQDESSELFQPIYGRQKHDVAPDGALRLGTRMVLQIFRPYGTLMKCCWGLHLIRVSFSLSKGNDKLKLVGHQTI